MEVFTKFNVISTAVPLGEGLKKKKKWKIPLRGGGVSTRFSTKKKTKKQDLVFSVKLQLK